MLKVSLHVLEKPSF